jgi:hypothetical protein
MSRIPDDESSLELDDATLRALRASDDLVPTTPAEVERAEATLADLELPENLQQYRPRATTTRNAAQPRPKRPLAGYAVAAGLGALAAAAAFVWFRPAVSVPVTSAGGELVRKSASAPEPAIPLVFRSRCERECCAGSACKAASPALTSCPSGISCVACAPDNVNGGPYRLRLGSVIVSEAGQKVLPLDAPLELCVVGSSSDRICLPALGEPGGDAWRLLKAVTPLSDLLVGLTFELKKRGETAILASWKRAVSPTADIMCKGLAVPLSDGTETLGRLSVFVEPTHFVELGRAPAVPALLKTARRFQVSGLRTRVYEATASGPNHFALVLGPLDKSDAESLRWQVLDHGLDATITHGLDFVGPPRPAD